MTATTSTGSPPRPGGNGGRCACPTPAGVGGHRRDASHVHSYAGRQGRRSAVPRGHRRKLPHTARGLDRPNNKRSAETGPEQDPSTPNSLEPPVSGLLVSIGASDTDSSTPFCLVSTHGPLAADRGSHRQGLLPPSAAPPALGCPLSFSRPLRRPGARSLPPPGHMAPDGAVLLSRTTGRVELHGAGDLTSASAWRTVRAAAP
jgi:hypothetical protein